jgi:hypothetical protein
MPALSDTCSHREAAGKIQSIDSHQSELPRFSGLQERRGDIWVMPQNPWSI